MEKRSPSLKELIQLVQLLDIGCRSGNGLYLTAVGDPRVKSSASLFAVGSSRPEENFGGAKIVLRSAALWRVLRAGSHPAKVGWSSSAPVWMGPGPLQDLYPGVLEQGNAIGVTLSDAQRRAWISPSECNDLLPYARNDVEVALRPLSGALESLKLRWAALAFSRWRRFEVEVDHSEKVGLGVREMLLRRVWRAWRREHFRRRRMCDMLESWEETLRASRKREAYGRLMRWLEMGRRRRWARLQSMFEVWAEYARLRAMRRRALNCVNVSLERRWKKEAFGRWAYVENGDRWLNVRGKLWERVYFLRWKMRYLETMRKKKMVEAVAKRFKKLWVLKRWRLTVALVRALRIGLLRGAFEKWRECPLVEEEEEEKEPIPDEIPSVLRKFCIDLDYPTMDQVEEWRKGHQPPSKLSKTTDPSTTKKRPNFEVLHDGGLVAHRVRIRSAAAKKRIVPERSRLLRQGDRATSSWYASVLASESIGAESATARFGKSSHLLHSTTATLSQDVSLEGGGDTTQTVYFEGGGDTSHKVYFEGGGDTTQKVYFEGDDDRAHTISTSTQNISFGAATTKKIPTSTQKISTSTQKLSTSTQKLSTSTQKLSAPKKSSIPKKYRERALERATAAQFEDNTRAACAIAGHWGFRSHQPGGFAGRIEHVLRRVEEAKKVLRAAGPKGRGPHKLNKKYDVDEEPTFRRLAPSYKTFGQRFAHEEAPSHWDSKEFH